LVTTTPAAPLSFGSITNDARIYLRGNTNEFAIGTNGIQTVYAGYQGHVFQTGSFGGAEAMRIDSSGITVVNTTTGDGRLMFADGTSGTDRYTGQIFYNHSSNYMAFGTNGGTERARIDSSGNLLVGTTSSPATLISATSGSGQALTSSFSAFTRESASADFPVVVINETGVDGVLLQFRKDGAVVGDIGANSGNIYIGESDTTLMFVGGTSVIIPTGTNGVTRDNAIDLGNAGNRFDDIYATNGTIQTSDRNEKQDIEVLSEAEQRVAVAAKGLLRKFRWKDSVEEKGDDARIHFGIIAQDLQAAFEAEGLDAGRYAMFIHSTWTDEETGEERSRMGVRYSELLAFIIAAI
jgi:hypothetical protein